MPHSLVVQLHFTRSEFARALAGLSEADARHRCLPVNSIGWIIGHLASAEQTIWLTALQGFTPLPHLNELFGCGQPASTPSLAQVWDTWQTVIQKTDPFLDTLTTQNLQETCRSCRCEQKGCSL